MHKPLFHFFTQLVVIAHLAFILFVIFGGFLIYRNRWMRFIHLLSMIWAIYAELSPGVICPLTALENYSAAQAGLSTYQEDFITRYLIPIIYQDSLSPYLQSILVGAVICINAVAYYFWWKRSSKNRRAKLLKKGP